jgi:hypothetical protein
MRAVSEEIESFMGGDWTNAPAPWKVFHARIPHRDTKFLPPVEMTQLFHPRGVESGVAMKEKKNQPEDAWESDAVWKLIDTAPAPKASPRFAENTLRAARNSAQSTAWWKSWKSLFAPAPLASLSTAAALAALAIAFFPSSDNTPFPDDSALSAETEEITDMENLIASIDQLDELSDSELIALIGY